MKDTIRVAKGIKKYRKKPIVVEALQLRWDTWNDMCDFAEVGRLSDGKPEGETNIGGQLSMYIPTLEGTMVADENDWVIKGIRGELYPCKPAVFEATYESVEEES